VDLEALSEFGKQMGLPAMRIATTDLTGQPETITPPAPPAK
jgi:hypothetical protein